MIMTLKELALTDLYGWMDELDSMMREPGFNGKSFPHRTGVKRMRTYLDHVASGLRMIRGGDYEPHDIANIHKKNKRDQWRE